MGTMVATPTYLSNAGRIGACIGFGRATEGKRMVTVTEGFRVEHACAAHANCQALPMAHCTRTFPPQKGGGGVVECGAKASGKEDRLKVGEEKDVR